MRRAVRWSALQRGARCSVEALPRGGAEMCSRITTLHPLVTLQPCTPALFGRWVRGPRVSAGVFASAIGEISAREASYAWVWVSG